MLEYRYDTQLLIDGEDLDEDAISDYFNENFNGDCLLAVGDEEMIKIHFHTNEPWKVLEYCASLGEIYDIVVEDMKSKGITPIYLLTDHTSFYEKYGWEFLCMVQGDNEPDMTRMYIHR